MRISTLINIFQLILLIIGIFIALNDLSTGLTLLLICFIVERIKSYIKKRKKKIKY